MMTKSRNKQMKTNGAVLFALCLIFASTFASLTTHITLSSDTYSSGDVLVVNWELTNDGDRLEGFLPWGTPVEGEWNADMFEIINEESAESAVYRGRILKRVMPTIQDFSFILPTGVQTGQLVLSEGYSFNQTGVYQITMMFVHRSHEGELYPVVSNKVQLNVLIPDVEEESFFRTLQTAVNFKGCSSSQTTTVNSAITNAISASSNARNYLSKSCQPAYVTWFGSYVSSRYSTVNSHFVNINNNLSGKGFGIDCSTCKQPGTYAYVYPTDKTHTIYLCSVFWTATTNPYGYNSQPGTLTHEMSHFNDVAGTNDYQYGVTGCKQLATSSPATAIQNADSHEYFQESKPTC